MTFYIPDTTKYDDIILFDIEYDQMSLVQFAGLLLHKVDNNLFKLTKSVNFYVKQNKQLNPFFVKYTNINDEFLQEKGVSWLEAVTLFNSFIDGINNENCLVVSHGVKNDLHVLEANNIQFNIDNHYCTYNNAKRILQRDNMLSLDVLAAESGYALFNAHNAYADVWGTLNVFCYLKELEE